MTGIEFEQYVYEILKRLGYKHLRLTRQSGDYGVDILASYRGVRYAFQCKYYSKPVGVSAIQQAYSGCEYYDYDEAVVVTNQTFTRQAYALAKNNGVILWDGEKLALMRRRANRHDLFYRFHHSDHHPAVLRQQRELRLQRRLRLRQWLRLLVSSVNKKGAGRALRLPIRMREKDGVF